MFYTLTLETEDASELKTITDAIAAAGVEGGPEEAPQETGEAGGPQRRTRRTKAQIEADATAAAPAAGTQGPAQAFAQPAATAAAAQTVFAGPATLAAGAAPTDDPLAAASGSVEVTMDMLRERVTAAIAKIGAPTTIGLAKEFGSALGNLGDLPQANWAGFYTRLGAELGV